MAILEFEGRSPAEAAIKACEQLGLTRSQLKYDLKSESGEGIDKKVVISVDSEIQPRAADDGVGNNEEGIKDGSESQKQSRGGRERGSRGPRGGNDRGGRGRERSDKDRGGRDRGGRDRDRGGKGRGDRNRSRKPRPQNRPPQKGGVDDLINVEAFASAFTPRPDVDGDVSERAQKAKELVTEMVQHMGLEFSVHIVEDGTEEIHVDIRGEDDSRLIGKKFETLLSLQFLINRMTSRHSEGEGIVVLDVGGYRVKRRAALADLATRLGERAMEEGKVVKLSPMSAHDRRVFHLTVAEIEGIETRSEGEGLYRNLLIVPTQFTQEEEDEDVA